MKHLFTYIIILISSLSHAQFKCPVKVSLAGAGLCENNLVLAQDIIDNPVVGIYGCGDGYELIDVTFEYTSDEGRIRSFVITDEPNDELVRVIENYDSPTLECRIVNCRYRYEEEILSLPPFKFTVYFNKEELEKASQGITPSYVLSANYSSIRTKSQFTEIEAFLRSNCGSETITKLKVEVKTGSFSEPIKTFICDGNELSENALAYLNDLPKKRTFYLDLSVMDLGDFNISNERGVVQLMISLE